MDFRDIEAFDENTALVLGIASPAYFFKTKDGGATWKLVHFDERPEIFYDAFDFWVYLLITIIL